MNPCASGDAHHLRISLLVIMANLVFIIVFCSMYVHSVQHYVISAYSFENGLFLVPFLFTRGASVWVVALRKLLKGDKA